MKKLTRDRVEPIISASVSWDNRGSTPAGESSRPYRASSSKVRASRFSLELNGGSLYREHLARRRPLGEHYDVRRQLFLGPLATAG